MSINGISNQNYTPATQPARSDAATTTAAAKSTDKASTNESGVIYESSKDKPSKTTTYKQNTALIAQLKADSEKQAAQMRSLVEDMMTKQGHTIGNSDSMWKFLAGGKFTVDAATSKKAAEDISENGYWGVNQTSDRIVSFAKALTGGNPDKIDEMISAFEKGYKAATKSWGKSLPDISSKTRDAVLEKFDSWKKETSEQVGTTN